MPAISKVRFTNVVYENGEKRYNDDIFQFDGENSAILLENGGGKTVFIQTAIQAILPHSDLAERKIKNTLLLENSTAHVAIEWILSEKPKRYALTAVTLFMNKGVADSLKYVYEYGEDDENSIDKIPFVKESINGKMRSVTKEEAYEYYYKMCQDKINAKQFNTIKEYNEYIEKNFKIIPSEWRKIALINGSEGDVEAFFEACKTTGQLVDNLLIPTVEEALAGGGTKEFAETFEKQREHFKKYKQLKKRIDESKLVEKQINSYVKVYEEFEELDSKFNRFKENIKALYIFAKKEEEKNKEKFRKLEEANQFLEAEETFYKQKEACYNLELLKDKMTKAESDFMEASDKYNELLVISNEKEKRLGNLQIAKYKQLIKVQQEKAELLRNQISLLKNDEDIEDLEESLNENSRELRGYFKDQEDCLNKEINLVEAQIRNVQKEYESFEVELKKIKDKEQGLLLSKANSEGTINVLISDMEIIERELLNTYGNEKIQVELEDWKIRAANIESEVFENNKRIKNLEEEKKELQQNIPTQREELNRIKGEETKLSEQIKAHNEVHNSLLSKLKEFRSSWYNIDSLHLKQNTVTEQLENKEENLKIEKEKLLFLERISNRWVDNYSESDYYTADPLIEKYIKSWRNSFNYIESGTEYIQRAAKNIDKSEIELNKIYPYWTVSIITSESEVDKLINKVKNLGNEISHPVIVMTEKEAKAKVYSELILSEESIFFPPLWGKNIVQNDFNNWKKEVTTKAAETTRLRKKKEEELKYCSELFKEVRNFYCKYPYEEYKEIQKQQKLLKYNIELASEEIDKKEGKILGIDRELKKINKVVAEAKEEKSILEQKIIKANEYIKKKNQKLNEEIEIHSIKEKLINVKNDAFKYERRINSAQELISELKNKLYDINLNLSIVKVDSFYDEVNNVLPKYSSKSKEFLIQQRKDFKAALGNKQKGRETLEENFKSALENTSNLQSILDNFKSRFEYEVNEELKFPLYGENEINRVINELNNLKQPLEQLKNQYEKAKSSFEKKKNSYEDKKENYYSQYSKIIPFSMGLEQIEKLLKEERETLSKKKRDLQNQRELLEKERDDIKDSTDTLDKYNIKYFFLAQEVKEVELSENIKNEFPYRREIYIKNIIERIEILEKQLEEKKQNTEDKKREFIKFCENEIIDVKIKYMAVAGVQQRKSYLDILQWQNKMNERILRTIEISENDIRVHDLEIQQFINHLHSYLSTMLQELKQIPQNTRIKVGDSWKEVFIFNVPEYDEREGKEELSKHIDWMLRQLEGQQFKDENGLEIEAVVKKSIEKWLQAKQLLQIVLKQSSIKVKCRKVTNDNKINSIPYSWEVSNSWSGGEKWSKNMTLFLGILNYLAEKRTQITQNHKKHRTVIVDNPFGKASSDHILNPVFFIAEQLGFQIIALTAHAEGKFIRTYFPIVYSCKLRTANNGSSQIMTKEREIGKVFLKDNMPDSLYKTQNNL